MSAISDFIAGFKRGYKRGRGPTVEEAVRGQIADIIDHGVHDVFQAGYAEALIWTLEASGRSLTDEMITLRAVARRKLPERDAAVVRCRVSRALDGSASRSLG